VYSWKTRNEFLSRIKEQTLSYDLCIVGGGITGAAIAREAAAAGLKTLLAEKNDFAYGTSSRSSKLVHGGVRYLEHFEFKLVAESTLERARLWKVAPQLVKPLPFLFPAYQDSRLPLWKLDIGLWLYDILSLFSSPTIHKKLNAQETHSIERALNTDGLEGAIRYWDALTDDSLLTLSNILDARALGAEAMPRLEVIRVDWNAQTPFEKSEYHTVHMKADGADFKIKCKVLVSATGPWTDRFFETAFGRPSRRMATTRGSHIVVSKEKIPLQNAVVMTHPKDGRVLFGIPWSKEAVIGTTDIFDNNSADSCVITPAEIEYLVDASNSFFPNHPIKKEDIISVWSGLRPLLAPPSSEGASDISREHSIEWFNPGALVIAGGKLTTHRVMGFQTVERILQETNYWESPLIPKNRPTNTRLRPLPQIPQLGVRDLSPDLIETICKDQMLMTLEDLLVRRTDIFYGAKQNGLEYLKTFKSSLCTHMEWSPTMWDQQVEDYLSFLKANLLEPLGRKLPPF
jgi:glycerol-3-phosphate dehydrogenase